MDFLWPACVGSNLCLFPRPAGGQSRVRDDAADNAAKLSDAGVAGLAAEMWLPEGLFRAVIDRYPQLNRVLASRYRALLVLLKERDDVIDVLRIAQAGERHAVAFDLGLRVLEIGAQIDLVPH